MEDFFRRLVQPTRQNVGLWLGAIGVYYAFEFLAAMYYEDKKKFTEAEREAWNNEKK